MAYTTIRTQTLVVVTRNDDNKAKKGFLSQLVKFAAGKKTFQVSDLVKRFSGKPAPTKGKRGAKAKVTTERITRYAYWCVANGIFAVVE